MTRSIIWILLCLVLIFAIDIVVSQIIVRTCDDIDGYIADMEQAALEGDWPGVQQSIRQTELRWQKSRNAWETVADHADAETINVLMGRIAQLAHDQNAPDFLLELKELQITLQHVQHGQRLAWYNIF